MFPARIPTRENFRCAGFLISQSNYPYEKDPQYFDIYSSYPCHLCTNRSGCIPLFSIQPQWNRKVQQYGRVFRPFGADFFEHSRESAGIGLYRKSEVTFTPSVFIGSTESNFLGKVNSERKFNFNFGNAGIVFTNKLTNNDEGPGWKSWSFGFGYNRINNFHNRSFMRTKILRIHSRIISLKMRRARAMRIWIHSMNISPTILT